MVVSIFVDQELEPFHGDIRHVRQVVLDAFKFLFDARHQLVGFVFAEFQDALHLDFHESQNVLAYHWADEIGLERFESLVDIHHGSIHILGIFKPLVFIDALFDEYLFERREEELLQ